MQSLQRLREPAAIGLLVLLALRLLVGVVTFVVLSRGGTDDTLAVVSRWAYGDNSFALAAFSLASSALDGVTAVVLVGLVASCALWRPTPRARSLALAGSAVLALGVVLSLVAALVWLVGVRLSVLALADFLRLVLAVPMPLLAAVALWRMVPAVVPAKVPAHDAGPRELPSADPTSRPQAQPQVSAPVVPADDQPTWQPEEAAGAAWSSAGQAAAGAAASGWGTSADRGGWVPSVGSPATPERDLGWRQPTDTADRD